MLILTRNVTNYTINMTVDHQTEDTSGGSGDAAFEAHHHAYTGTKSFLVLNALKAGEKVLLLRVQGGKKFVVIDRVNV
jgi:sortase (surface protein transpeptidase)